MTPKVRVAQHLANLKRRYCSTAVNPDKRASRSFAQLQRDRLVQQLEDVDSSSKGRLIRRKPTVAELLAMEAASRPDKALSGVNAIE